MSSRNTRRARERLAEARARQARRHRRRRLLVIVVGVIVAGGAAAGIAVAASGPGSGAGTVPSPSLLAPLSTLGALRPAPPVGAPGPEGVPVPEASVLAGTSPGTTGQSIDGIGCQSMEQTLFHIHAHLTLIVNGSVRQIPGGIGIPNAVQQGGFVVSGTCFYWLHTHTADGIIHIESPVQRTYTLGNFFDEWGQPLSSTQVGPAKGRVTAIYNDQVYRGNPRDIPLTKHAQIQLEVGKPLLAPEHITFVHGL